MSIQKHIVILIIPAFILLSCASAKQIEKKPPPKYHGTTLSKTIDDSGAVAIPKDLTAEFSTEDNDVIALLKIENLSGDHKLRWEWYDPDGDLYYSTGNFPLKISRGKFRRETSAWHKISIKGEPAADLPGPWKVNVFFDNELLESKPFIVKAYQDPILLPAGLVTKPFPKDWGLIIAIEDYANLPSVEYARKDALVVRDYFVRVLGVPEDNIVTLIDGEATKARMEGFIQDYFPSNADKDSTVYVYFAGHGIPGTTKGEPYLVPYDGDTRFIDKTGYKLINFYEDLNQLKVQRTYVFLDSCFSGMASRAAEQLIKGARPALVHVEPVKLPSSTIVSFNATSTGQMSNAYPEKEHGLFTYFLLRALKGESDTNDDGWASTKEIYTYIHNNVIRVSKRLSVDQTPDVMPPPDRLKDVGVTKVVR